MVVEPKTSILITGGNGRLGRSLSLVFRDGGIECLPLDHKEFDITNYDGMARLVDVFKPKTIIHTAAYTDVDGAENDWHKAMKVNLCGTDNLVRICDEGNIDLLFISTDYIFDGEKGSPYLESDKPSPVNVYGWSKLAGEYSILSKLTNYFIIRTSFLFGSRYDFIQRLLDSAQGESLPFSVGNFASPTSYHDLAVAIVALVKSGQYGVYHITNSGLCSRYQFAIAVLRRLEVNIRVIPVPKIKAAAPRPHYSVLSNSRWVEAGFPQLQSWHIALLEYLAHCH